MPAELQDVLQRFAPQLSAALRAELRAELREIVSEVLQEALRDLPQPSPAQPPEDKDEYTLVEVAQRVGRRSTWQLAQDCRDGRLYARKVGKVWLVSHAELRRLEQEGPRPVPRHAQERRQAV